MAVWEVPVECDGRCRAAVGVIGVGPWPDVAVADAVADTGADAAAEAEAAVVLGDAGAPVRVTVAAE